MGLECNVTYYNDKGDYYGRRVHILCNLNMIFKYTIEPSMFRTVLN